MIRNKGILIFTGFIFSMIFSHAVIILPAITKLTVKLYRPFLYVWFGLLQLSLIIRIVADLFEDVLCRKIGGFAKWSKHSFVLRVNSNNYEAGVSKIEKVADENVFNELGCFCIIIPLGGA